MNKNQNPAFEEIDLYDNEPLQSLEELMKSALSQDFPAECRKSFDQYLAAVKAQAAEAENKTARKKRSWQ